MAINEYHKTAKFTPLVLPYEMMMKAGENSQKRWDDAQNTLADAEAAFLKYSAIPKSPDEQKLAGIKQQFNTLQQDISNNPDITATDIKYGIRKFVNTNSESLNKIDQAYKSYLVGQSAKMKGESEGLTYPNEIQYNPSLWNSDVNTDYSLLAPKPYVNSRTITDPLINDLKDQFITYGANGEIIKGITKQDVATMALDNSSGMIQSLADERAVLKNKNYTPQLFTGRKWNQLNEQEQTAEILNRDFQEHVNMNLQLHGKSESDWRARAAAKAASEAVDSPYYQLLSNTNIGSQQAADLLNGSVNQDGSLTVNLSKDALITIPQNINLPYEDKQKLLLYQKSKQLREKYIPLSLMRELKSSSSIPIVGDALFGKTQEQKAKLKKQYDEGMSKYFNSDEYKSLQQEASDLGVDIHDNKFNKDMETLYKQHGLDNYLNMGAANPLEGYTKIMIDGTKENFINIGDKKYLMATVFMSKDEIKSKANSIGFEEPGGSVDANDAFGFSDEDDINEILPLSGDDDMGYSYQVAIPIDINNLTTFDRYNKKSTTAEIYNNNVQQWNRGFGQKKQDVNYFNKANNYFTNPEIQKIKDKQIKDIILKNINGSDNQNEALSIYSTLLDGFSNSKSQEEALGWSGAINEFHSGLIYSKDIKTFIKEFDKSLSSPKGVSQGNNSNPLGLGQ